MSRIRLMIDMSLKEHWALFDEHLTIRDFDVSLTSEEYGFSLLS